MKKGYVKLLLISLIMTISVAVINYTKLSSLYAYALFLLVSLLITRFLMGFESDDFTNKKEITIVIVGSILLYYTLTYSTVFFWGILTNRFVLSMSNIFKTIIPLFLIIIFTELLRYIIIRKGRRYKTIWIIAILLFTFIEASLKTRGYDFALNIQILKFSLEVVAVVLAKNIFLCYLTNKVGYKPAILFRSLIDVPLYILPFFPNFGIFMDSVIKIVFPNVLLFFLAFVYSKADRNNQKIADQQTKIVKNIGLAIVIIFAITVVALSSAKFKYFTIVIGSGSMSPVIDKGDLVLVKKVTNIDELKKHDVLIFRHDGSTIIHRIIRIETNGNEKLFYTKGDANASEDFYPVSKNDVVGIANFKIKYIGYPTVWLNEQMK